MSSEVTAVAASRGGASQNVEGPRVPAVRVEGLGKCYGIYARPLDRLKQTLYRGRRQFCRDFWALRHVSFEVARGGAYGIIGRNGSGKSTLLQIIAGTLRPTEGQVEVHGRVAALLELGCGFNPEFTGRENVFLNGAILGLPQTEVEAHFDDIASFADIGSFLEMPVKTYSTGMLVRLAFAVHAMLEPDILIVDEALAVGDASFQRRCYRHLEKLRERGVALLFVSHSIELVRSICDGALYLERGTVKRLGRAPEVCDAYLTDLLAEQTGDAVVEKSAKASPAGAASGPVEMVLDAYEPASRSHDKEQGNRSIEVVRADLRAVQPGASILYEGDHVRIRAVLQANAPATSFVFGVLLRDRYGADVFGFSKASSALGVQALRSGEHVTVEAVVKCDLRADTYFVTLGVQADEFSEIYYYAHDVLKFTLQNPASPGQRRMVGGLARLEHSVAAVAMSL